MKKVLFTWIILMSIFTLQAQNILEEDFDYTGYISQGNGWIHQSSSTNLLQTTTPGLTFYNYPGSDVGNALLIKGVAGEDAYKKFAARRKLYYSFMIKVVPATNTPKTGYVSFLGKEQVSGVNGTLNGNYFARIAVQTFNDGTWKIGTSNWAITNTTDVPVYSTTFFQTNQTYAVIVSFDMDDNYKVNIWVKDNVYPTSEMDAGIPDVTFTKAPNTAALPTSVDVVGVRQDATSANVIIDGIRIFDTWSAKILPLRILSFTARLDNGDNVLLNWKTDMSTNVKCFEIEKSMDAHIFSLLTTINCFNINDVMEYSCKDYSIKDEHTFYRIKVIDHDGKYFYSSVLAVNMNGNQEIRIGNLGGKIIKVFYPNSIQIPKIRILDFNGMTRKVVEAVPGSQSVTIDLSMLPTGNYIMQLNQATSTISQKFVLQ